MWLQSWKQLKSHTSFAFYCKCSAIVFFFTLCVLIVACGTSTNSQVDPGNQSVTVTIDLNGSKGSPTPPLPDYLCGAWVTNNSPAVNPIVLKPNSVNKIVLVQVTFTKDGIPPCQVPQPAYFTPVLTPPTVTPPSPQPTAPSITPTIIVTVPVRPTITPSPKH